MLCLVRVVTFDHDPVGKAFLMRCSYIHPLAIALIISLLPLPGLAATVVEQAEQAAWVRWLIPLPKQIAIQQKVELSASDVKLTSLGDSSPAVKTAAEQIRSLFKQKAGADCRSGGFEIILGVCDASGKLGSSSIMGARKLASLPNAEQAYLIRPLGANRLVLTALNERGVYYAAQTLCQLLESCFHDGRVVIPLATIVDWPDLAERGLWGGSANQDIVWMSHYKMNLIESHVTLTVTHEGRGQAKADQQLIDLGRSHALSFVPVITHLNGLAKTGLYKLFPELEGKGDHAVHATHKDLVAPCCSQPKLTNVLADWMKSLASQPGVDTICAWLSELQNQFCDCSMCRVAGVGQHALEARCLINAWRIARKEHPNLQLRILLTQGSYKTNANVLAEIPPEVEVTYYDGSRTYDSSRDPMIYPLLERYAASGRWLGCYPQLTASWRIVCPWSCPQFIKYRMSEFVDKKLKCLCGYATPNNRLYEFNVTAAAEWSWNVHGRDTRQFAVAYWTRKRADNVSHNHDGKRPQSRLDSSSGASVTGCKNPEAAADWAVMLGPVGWDVYGSRIPAHNFFGRAASLVAGRRAPKLGEKGMFRYFPTQQHFDRDLAICDKAVVIAEQLDNPLMLNETKVIQGYVRMAKAIYVIAKQVHATKKPTYAQRIVLQKVLGQLTIAAMDTAEALQQWERCCRKDPEVGIGGSRLQDTIDVTLKTASDIAQSLESSGIRNVIGSCLQHEVGKWVTEDFDHGAKITKRFDVTRQIRSPGTYFVRFKYTSGWNGLRIARVALAGAPANEPDKLTDLSVDKHTGSAAVRNVANQYTVTLDNYNPAVRYFIEADVIGTPRKGRPLNRQGCNGSVSLQRKLPSDWRTRIEQALPMND